MSLATDILNEGKKLKEKYKYNSDPAVVRNTDGSLNFTDDKMDCSEFFLLSVKNTNAGLYSKLIDKLAGGNEGGNTKTIQRGIKNIEGITDLADLKQDNPAQGDWILWKDHIEMIEEVTAAGRYLTLGANGSTDTKVPKNIDCRNFDSVKKIATNFLGIWTPRLADELNPSLLTRLENIEQLLNAFETPDALDAAEIGLAPQTIGDLSTPVHMRKDNPKATMEARPPEGQAFPLFQGEGMPFNTDTDAAKLIANTSRIIDFLNVSNPAHKRYTPIDGKTFCNIYVCDACYLLGDRLNKYYVPRVWWTEAAANQIINGQSQVPQYGATLREMSANDLYKWFQVYGNNFGWVEQEDLDELQNYVNNTGHPGIIVGKKPGSHGHITVVVPEQSPQPAGAFKAVRNTAGKVINPLQSQAGSRNFEYGSSVISGKPWFTEGHISACYVYNKV